MWEIGDAGGRRWLVLGDMGEVGTMGPAFHREIGEYAREAGVENLPGLGVLTPATVDAFGAGAAHCVNAEALVTQLLDSVAAGDTILVKGSRFMRMERIVAALVGDNAAGAH